MSESTSETESTQAEEKGRRLFRTVSSRSREYLDTTYLDIEKMLEDKKQINLEIDEGSFELYLKLVGCSDYLDEQPIRSTKGYSGRNF